MLALTVALLMQVQIPADAYADSATRALVTEARAARERNERLVTAYRVRASQRIGLGIRALSRDRMLWRQELVADISWRRDSVSTATVVGAREAAPVAQKGDQVPSGLRGDVQELVFDPASDLLRVVGADGDDDGFVYPLREGSELDYRFAIGGTTTIGLPDGKQVRLVELHVTPRRAEWRLINGSLWFDADTKGLVRAAFKPARPYELQRDLDPEDKEDVPGWVNARAEVRFVALEYGLYESRWWMPRYTAIDAVGTVGARISSPFRIERVYQDYEVEGGTPPDPDATFIPAGRERRAVPSGEPRDSAAQAALDDSIDAVVQRCISEATQASSGDRATRVQVRVCRDNARDSSLTVIIPEDTQALLTAPELGAPILGMGDLITEAELRGLADAIDGLPDRPWDRRLELPNGWSALLSEARYNRVEALSLGLRGAADLGRVRLDALARIGVADLEPNGEVALVREGADRRYALGVYRRLAAANPAESPLGIGNSVMALFFGRDDGQYFRTRGVELGVQSLGATRWSMRVYHEQQREALVETDFSIPGIFDGDPVFGSNFAALPATQSGASLWLHATRAVSRAVTLGADLALDAARGDFDFESGAITLRATVIPQGKLAGSLALTAGTSHGEVPPQSLFRIGGAATLRGYPGSVAAGNAYWLTRAEVGNTYPAARLIGFVDAGWAGDRTNWNAGRTLLGAGIGASFLDGLVRVDLARGLREPKGWRVEFYFDGML